MTLVAILIITVGLIKGFKNLVYNMEWKVSTVVKILDYDELE